MMWQGCTGRYLRGAVVCGLLFGFAAQASAQQPAAVPQFSFNGNSYFPIALYNYPVAGGASTQSAASLREMAAAGFNTLLQYDHSSAWESAAPLTPSTLSADQKYGLAVVDQLWTYNLTTDNWIGMPGFDVTGSPLYNQVNLLKSHPDLLGWETFDEASGYLGGQSLPNLAQGYTFVKSLDTVHPILSNENPRNSYLSGLDLMPWASIGDTLSNDWYAVDSAYSQPWPLNGIPTSVDYLHASASNGNAPYASTKPIYDILQGGPSTSGGPEPTFANDRYTMYSSIIHGSTAAIWWGSHQLHPTDQMWLDLKRCAGELRDLEPVLENGYLLGVDRTDAVTGASYSTSNVVLGNSNLQAIGYWYYEAGGTIDNYVIVVNTSPTSNVTSTIAVGGWNAARNGNKTRVLFETSRTSIATTSNTWTDTFAPFDVHVYTDRKQNSTAMDFDGDGTADAATFDPTTGDAVITYSSSGRKVWVACPSGTSSVRAYDADGDGKVDISAYNPSLGYYKVLLSSTNYTTTRAVAGSSGATLPVLATPANLTVASSGTQAVLSWPAASGAASYTIYRANLSGNEGVTPYKTGITASTYTDTGLSSFTNYYYTVAAVNSSGFTSDQSNEVHCVDGPSFGNERAWDDGVNLYLQLNYTGSYSQFWAYLDTDDNAATGYNWYGIGANYVLQNNSLYTDTDLANGSDWSFSYNTGATLTNTGSLITWSLPLSGIGSPSAAHIIFEGVTPNNTDPTVVAYTKNPTPTPSGLTIAAGNAANALTWTATPGAVSYNIYRSTASGAEGSSAYASGITSPSYTDSAASNGTTYFYTVASVNGNGTSPQSGEVSAKPWLFSNEEAWHDATTFYFKCDFNAPYVNFNVLLDTDKNAATGYAYWGIGADYMIENTGLWQSTANGPGWNWQTVPSVAATSTTLANDTAVLISVPLSAIGTPASGKVVVQGFDVNWNGATDPAVISYSN